MSNWSRLSLDRNDEIVTHVRIATKRGGLVDYGVSRMKITNEADKESFNTGSMAVSHGSSRKKERAAGRESLILD